MNIFKYLFGDRVYVECLRRGRITLISVPLVCVGTRVVPSYASECEINIALTGFLFATKAPMAELVRRLRIKHETRVRIPVGGMFFSHSQIPLL